MPALPAECVLRPANAADQPLIQRLLTNLEQETRSDTVLSSWFGKGLGFGLLGLVGIYALIVPGGLRSLLRLLMLPILIVSAGAVLLNLSLQREWKQYWVIEANGYLVACAKLQRQGNYSVLYDLYVVPDWRKRGIGSHLVSYLGQQATKPLYLACLPTRLSFYRRLGFAPIAPKQLPGLLQYDLGLPTRRGIIPLVLT
ncbi:MAG TPA: GNAT family N-acetyltransferase [Thermosynechococcaceae cyanobacterium]